MRKISKSHLCIAVSVLALAVGAGVPAHAQESGVTLQALQDQINSLQKQLAQIQAAQAKAPKTVEKRVTATNAVTVDDKGAFVLPKTGTTIKIGGYVKGDMIHDFSSRPTLAAAQDSTTTDSTNFSTIPTSADNIGGTNNLAGRRSNSTRLTARESRLNVTTSTPTTYGPFGTVIEADFWGAGGTATSTNSYGFRLRRAFATYSGFLVGQEWSTFADTEQKANTLDINGPVGLAAIRQAQIRYTYDFKNGQTFAVALENPETDVGTAGATTPTTINYYPDMIAAWKLKSDWGHVSARAMGRNLATKGIPAAATYEQNKWGYGLAASGKINPFYDKSGAYSKDNVIFLIEGGNGIGRYLSEAANMAGATDANTNLELLSSWGGNVGYQHYWKDNLRSTVVYGYMRTEQKSFLDANAQKSSESVHANLIWSPVPSVDVGIEYIWGHRTVHNDAQGFMNRLQASAMYKF